MAVVQKLDLSGINNLFQQYFIYYDDIAGRINIATQGYRKYLEQKEEKEIPTVFKNLNDIQNRLGRFENSINLSTKGGLVDIGVFSQMEQALSELQMNWFKIKESWERDTTQTMVTSAIKYWQNTTLGKYVYDATIFHLRKLREADKTITQAKDTLTKLESIKNTLSPQGMEIYNDLKSKTNNADLILSVIQRTINLDEAYQTFGLGKLTQKVIILSLQVIAIIVIATALYLLARELSPVAMKGLSLFNQAQEVRESFEKKRNEAKVTYEQNKSQILASNLSEVEKTKRLLENETNSLNTISTLNNDEKQELAKVPRIDWNKIAKYGAITVGGLIALSLIPRLLKKKE